MEGKTCNMVPLRKKVLICFSIIIIILGIMSSILYYNMSKTLHQFDNVYRNLKVLEEYSDTIEDISDFLNKYLSQGDRTYISDFYQEYETLLKKITHNNLHFINEEENMLFIDIKYMFESYGNQAEEAIKEYRKRNVSGAATRLSRALKIQSYIQNDIQKLIFSHISESKAFQKDLFDKLLALKTLIVFLILISTMLYALLAVYFNIILIKPIDSLVAMAEKILKGKFDVEEVKISSHSELKILSDTLYRMSCEIKSYIEKIKEKAEVEKLLQNEKMENLKVNALLKEAELKKLQAQINPHFLFNTLTTLHHTAFLEDANETCEIVEAISKILRYNLRTSNAIVQLKDEIENIKYYLYIQEKRYKHRVQMHFDIDEEQLDLPIPNMTVQPIIENSFIHGIENSEDGGLISLRVYRDGGYVIVEIKDNGVGIERGRLNEIKNIVGGDSDYQVHTSSIGINNVVKRLEAFYNTKGLFDIQSAPNKGTVITLSLPYNFIYKRPRKSADEYDEKLLEG